MPRIFARKTWMIVRMPGRDPGGAHEVLAALAHLRVLLPLEAGVARDEHAAARGDACAGVDRR